MGANMGDSFLPTSFTSYLKMFSTESFPVDGCLTGNPISHFAMIAQISAPSSRAHEVNSCSSPSRMRLQLKFRCIESCCSVNRISFICSSAAGRNIETLVLFEPFKFSLHSFRLLRWSHL